MSDFLDVTKYLDKFPVRVATYQEALNDRIPFDKFYGKVSTRAIKKIFWYIQLQPFFISQSIPGRLLFQYNIIAPAPFYILNAVPPQGFSGPNGMQCVITVKWRVGTVVHRFCILNKQYKGPLRYYLNHVGKVSYIDTFPNYVNQVVQRNCVFEVWASFLDLTPQGHVTINSKMNAPLNIQTSLMSDPITADDVAVIFDAGSPFGITDIGVNLPETLPYNQPTIAWNTN